MFAGLRTPSSKFERFILPTRRKAEQEYVFDRLKISDYINDVIDNCPFLPTGSKIEVIDGYTLDRYCFTSRIEDEKTVLMDYGFIELVADTMCVEYLSYKNIEGLTAWTRTGRPEKWNQDDPGQFEVDGVGYQITGSMLMRDVACKLLEKIEHDSIKRNRLVEKILWPTEDGKRPCELFYNQLLSGGSNVNVAPAFCLVRQTVRSMKDQVVLASAFIACHEICHLVYSKDAQQKHFRGEPGQYATAYFIQLIEFSIRDLDRSLKLGDIVRAAYNDPTTLTRVHQEVAVDFLAVDILLENFQKTPGESNLAIFIPNFFGILSVINSLGIYRYHLMSAIQTRTYSEQALRFAQSEAVTRNLYVLSYLFARYKALTGKEPYSPLFRKICPESLTLSRRTVFFSLDLTSGVGEENWSSFVSSALS